MPSAAICRNQVIQVGRDPRRSVLPPCVCGMISSDTSPGCSEHYLFHLGKLQGLGLGSPYHCLLALKGEKKIPISSQNTLSGMPVVFPRY